MSSNDKTEAAATSQQFTNPFGGTATQELRRGSDNSQNQDYRRGSDGSENTGSSGEGPPPTMKKDRRLSKEWDAAFTPPSRFQHVEGSIFATPASRDGRTERNKIHGFKEKVKELAGGKK